jgi:FkbM family methyltransferase
MTFDPMPHPSARSSLRSLAWRVVNPVLGSPLGSRVSENLVKILMRGIGVNVGHLIDESGESWLVPRILRACPGAICADVGANAGDYTELLAKHGAGSIFAFEPIPQTFARLNARVAALPRVHTFNVAVGEQAGSVTIYVSRNEGSSTLASRDAGMAATNGDSVVPHEVPLITLDGLCFERDLTFDFVKIDVEGFELEVLRGAARLLAERPPAVLQIEFNHHHLHRRHHMGDYFDALSGYRIFRLAPRSLFPLRRDHYLSTIYTYQNLIAIHSERKDLLKTLS